MKVLYFLALFAFTVTAFPVEEGRINGENGWYIPQENGTFYWMSLHEAESKMAELQKENPNTRGISLNPVTFHLYTWKNPTKHVKISPTVKSVDDSYFNRANPTRFIIHGWIQTYTASMNKNIRDAWFTQGDFNIIVVDWSRARSVDYASSVLAVEEVGKKVATMIDFLVRNYGMSLDDLVVIGHSLGAHVSGYAGKKVKTGKIGTIVGLDPALPLFNYDKPTKRLSSTDAVYVESIHTNGGSLGFLHPIGVCAFYPNGGKSQPGCGLDITGACDHGRSTTYYAEAIEANSFPSVKCSDYKAAVSKNCGTTYAPAKLGSPSNALLKGGEYFVPVNSKAPYGMGFEDTFSVNEDMKNENVQPQIKLHF